MSDYIQMDPRLILVTGATGAVGAQIVRALDGSGYSVRVLALDPPTDDLKPFITEMQVGDITDPATVNRAMENVQGVIHLAALLHIVNPSPMLKTKYERINVGGTQNVVDVALQHDVKRIVFFSTIAVYGSGNGTILTEESEPHPDTLYAMTKLAAEHIVLEARNSEDKPIGTVLRMGAIYGARIKGNYLRLVQSLARGQFVSIGNGLNRRTLVYERDVADAALLALEHPAALGHVYNVSDGQFHTLNQIMAAICTALGRTPPRWVIPAFPARVAAGVIEDTLKLIGKRSSIGRSTVDKFTEDIAVSSMRIQSKLDFVPTYDLAAGWLETVAEMKRLGEV